MLDGPETIVRSLFRYLLCWLQPISRRHGSGGFLKLLMYIADGIVRVS